MIAGYSVLWSSYQRRVAATSDVFSALVLFLELHDGRFPASEEEFVRDSFERKGPHSELVVRDPGHSLNVGKVYGTPFNDLKAFEIRYGTPLADLDGTGSTVVSRQTGEDILLIKLPEGEAASRKYTKALFEVWTRIEQDNPKSVEPLNVRMEP